MKKIFTFFTALGLAGFMMTILAPGAGAQFSDTHHMLNAIEDNDIANARGYLFNGANPNARRGGDPALIMAVREKYYEMMRLLLEYGAYPDRKSLPGEVTAVMIAATTGDETALALLLEFGADINLADKQGRTSLMKAAAARKSRVVRILIENGADIFATDYTGRDALQYAREGRARSVIRILEEAGVD